LQAENDFTREQLNNMKGAYYLYYLSAFNCIYH